MNHDENDRMAITEARLDRIENEHVSIMKILLETRDGFAQEFRNLNTMLTAMNEGLAKPGRGMNDRLLETFARIMTRVRALEEAFDDMRGIVIEGHENTREMLELARRAFGGRE